MLDRVRTAAILAASIATLASAVGRPAAAATTDHCTYVSANEPQGQIATTWYRLGGRTGPMGCPSTPAINGSQTFQHGTISQPRENPGTTLATYLLGGKLHVSVTSLGHAVDRFQVASEDNDGSQHLWSFNGGSSAAFVADLPHDTQSPFRVKLYACQAHESVFTTAAYVCDRSEAATAVSAPLELTMDANSPRTAPTGAVALRH